MRPYCADTVRGCSSREYWQFFLARLLRLVFILLKLRSGIEVLSGVRENLNFCIRKFNDFCIQFHLHLTMRISRSVV